VTVPRDLVCLSHLRWDFVYQRPNHLMARAARDRRVYFIEEPVAEEVRVPALRSADREGVTVVTPVLPAGLDASTEASVLAALIDELAAAERIRQPVLWYYTPMALPWTRQIAASAVVYDSMDHLAGFRGAPPQLLALEADLLDRADLVFTGGRSLHRRMAGRHPDAHCFPSSIDLRHFRTARSATEDAADQAPIARPRIGYAGVIDERLDLELIDGVAAARPDWSIALVGPIAKIDPADVPAWPNVHRLGLKPYAELPRYFAGWDIGWMPFARNEATRYISPTKTPEYLAAGLPVVSTSIHDVVDPYGDLGLVSIADTVDATVASIDRILAGDVPARADVDAFLARGSWDGTWSAMAALIDETIAAKAPSRRLRLPQPVRAARPVGGPAVRPALAGRGGSSRPSLPAPAAAGSRTSAE
jgi:UDP-galactopyranose mutase